MLVLYLGQHRVILSVFYFCCKDLRLFLNSVSEGQVRKMLYYTEVDISPLEVPGEMSLCIYISGCQNRCCHCHYPQLQQPDYGAPLGLYFRAILELYSTRASCVCFLGEGENSFSVHEEFQEYCRIAKEYRFRTCLYSGREIHPEPWMDCFDYVKVGSFQEHRGPLSSPSTNQRMFQKTGDGYCDITQLFWDE